MRPRSFLLLIAGIALLAILPEAEGDEELNFHPSEMGIVGGFEFDANINDVAVSGNYAYLAIGTSGLEVVDISDPTNPTRIGGVGSNIVGMEDDGNLQTSVARYVEISGNYAYVANDYYGLTIYDITDPANPQLAGSNRFSQHEFYPDGLVISNGYAYVHAVLPTYYDNYSETSQTGLFIIDISDPTNPVAVSKYRTRVGNYQLYDDVKDIAIVENYIYLFSSRNMLIINVSDPVHPGLVALMDFDDGDDLYIRGVDIAGNYAYLVGYRSTSSGYGGLLVVDLSDPAKPTYGDSYSMNITAESYDVFDVAVIGSYAYVALQRYSSEGEDLLVLDITNPTQPVYAGEHTRDSSVYVYEHIVASGDDVYIFSGYGEMILLNLFDPTKPATAGIHSVGFGSVYEVQIYGNYLYTLNYRALLVFEISNPTEFNIVGLYFYEFGFAGSTDSLTIAGSYAYVTYYNQTASVNGANPYELLILDISDPTDPTYAGSYNGSYLGYGSIVAISDNHAYISAEIDSPFEFKGIVVLNVSNPASPQFTGSYELLFSVECLTVKGGYAYICTPNEAGSPSIVKVLDVSEPSNPTYVEEVYTPGSPREIVISHNLGFVADGGGIFIMNLSDVHGIETLKSGYINVDCEKVVVIDSYASAICSEPSCGYDSGCGGAIDFTDYLNPQQLSSLYTYQFKSMFFSNNYLYAIHKYGTIVALGFDSDGDGVGDDLDACDNTVNMTVFGEGVSSKDRFGCQDIDYDGWSDSVDAFPANPNEWNDQDSDQVGSNEDPFPFDSAEWSDVDHDNVGDNGDAFPYDSNEWIDSDGDGRGDNGDAFPHDPNEWADQDKDGVGDNSDAFPLSWQASLDRDGDGYPDEWNANLSSTDEVEYHLWILDSDEVRISYVANEDLGNFVDNGPTFVCNNGNTIPAGWYDDGDNDCGDWSDEPEGNSNADFWQYWDGSGFRVDTDGDGYDDDYIGNFFEARRHIDAFPNDPDEWKDSDLDGAGDNGDPMPNNAKVKAWWQVGLILLVLVTSGAAANYGYGQYTLARRVSGKIDELRAKIEEFREKGINTDELERVLAECEAEMGGATESEE